MQAGSSTSNAELIPRIAGSIDTTDLPRSSPVRGHRTDSRSHEDTAPWSGRPITPESTCRHIEETARANLGVYFSNERPSERTLQPGVAISLEDEYNR